VRGGFKTFTNRVFLGPVGRAAFDIFPNGRKRMAQWGWLEELQYYSKIASIRDNCCRIQPPLTLFLTAKVSVPVKGGRKQPPGYQEPNALFRIWGRRQQGNQGIRHN
jgi:hypothetical protein